MRLFESPDFDQAVIAASQHLNIREQIVEKDYYVTEALRILAEQPGNRIIFKGGTSLSKGWNLIQRFSEDIDIFLDPEAFMPSLGKRGIDRELKVLRDAIDEHPALTFAQAESQTIGGFGRSDVFRYVPLFTGAGAIAPRVLVEAGTASGREPTETVVIQSYIGRFLRDTETTLGAEDEQPFSMRLLHFRRTFVEKMFAIHSKIELYKREGLSLGSYARHYYDLYQLAQQEAVRAMLAGEEYAQIKEDYEKISLAAFPKSYFRPEDMRFANSEALFPSGDLRQMIVREYLAQCSVLCYGAFPSWEEIEACFNELRASL